MDLYARVNVLDGKAVRLPRGRIDDVIFLDADPVERAHGWVAKGADRLLVVDLDAAINGDYRNRTLVGQIIQSAGVPVQVAGGVRSKSEIERLLEAGAWRIGMGTLAIIDQVLFWEICREYPDRIVVSLDVGEGEELAIRGWTEGSGHHLEETLIALSSAGAAGFMISEVGRDALTDPPNFAALRTALSIVDQEVIAAGGVRNLDDIRRLMALEAEGRHLTGVVVGREVTSGRFTVEEAVRLLRGGGRTGGPWSSEQLQAALVEYGQVLSDLGRPDSAASVAHAEAFLRWLDGGTL